MRRSSVTLICGAILLLFSSSVASFAQAGSDWPQWRGPNRDGISKETGLLKQWPKEGPPLVWKTKGAGGGYSSFAIANGRLFTMGLRGEREFIIAFDVANGKEVWATPHGKAFHNDRGDGPRGTPTVDGERLYALGGSGDLSCLEAGTGRIVWTMNVLQKFGGSNTNWGISESPLVIDEKVLVNAGGPGASIVALNKKDGALIWKSQSDEPGYSSAISVEAGGIKQVVFFTSSRAVGLDLSNGRARGNRVFISSDYGTGGGLVEIKANGKDVTAREVYFTKEMRNHHSSSVLVGDYLYGFSSSILTAMRFDTGEIVWRDRSVGKGSLIYADGNLYCLSENGVVGLVEATPAAYREKGRFQIPQESLPTWTHPVVAGSRLYLRDQDTIYAFDIREKK